MLLVLLRAAQEQRTCWASTWLEEAAWSTASPGSKSATVATAHSSAHPALTQSPAPPCEERNNNTAQDCEAVSEKGVKDCSPSKTLNNYLTVRVLVQRRVCCLNPPLPAPLPSLPKRHSRKLQRKAFDWLQLTGAGFIPAEHLPGIPAVS